MGAKAIRTLLYCSIALVLQWTLWAITTSGQSQRRLQVRGRLDERILAKAIPNPQIWAYDLSPDGARLGLFVVSTHAGQTQDFSWIVLVNAMNSTILKQMRFGSGSGFVQSYTPQIAFTSDGKFLVIQDEQTVAVLDSSTLVNLRTIEPPAHSKFKVPAGIVVASKSDIGAVSFGTGTSRLRDGTWPVCTEIIDVSTGKELAEWDGADVPMSISPYGNFVAVSNRQIVGRFLGVKILDSKSGKGVGSFPENLGRVPENYFAAVMARFLSEDSLVVTPDNGADQLGRNVAAYVDIVRFKDSQPLQQIDPENYGPTGEIAVSSDQSTFVTVSRYLPSQYREHPHLRIPPQTKPELLVFSSQERRLFKLISRTELPELLGLRMRSVFDPSGLRISKDGSVISVAEHYGIAVLARN